MDNARAAWELSAVRGCLRKALFLGWLLLPSLAQAGPRDDADALFTEAEAEDQAMHFAHACELYERSLRIDPGNVHAPRADARANDLRTHAEGNYIPLTRLERVRRDPALSEDAATIDALVRDADAFPSGLVRIETWALGAEAYARRLGRDADAATLYRKILTAPDAPSFVAGKAAHDLVMQRVDANDLRGADEVLALAGDRADGSLRTYVLRAHRRRTVHLASIGVLVSLLLLVGTAVARAVRTHTAGRIVPALRRTGKVALAFGLFAAVAGAVLGARHTQGTELPFVALGVLLLPLFLLARAWSAVGSPLPAARIARAALCASSAFALAFLVVERIDASFLVGFGF